MQSIKTPKKLIEVALPLDAINVAAAREKSIRHGHPSTLHLWWARRPLAAARAVIFAQLVNDPGYERILGRGVNKEKAQIERERLFSIMRKLVLWESTSRETVLAEARAEILKSWRETCELNRSHPQAAELFNPQTLPAFHDPFAGGGAIPLEAQRLGLESFASDLNPVAVLINRASIEIPARFAGRPPCAPVSMDERQSGMVQDWSGAAGIAEDVRRYAAWMREEAFRRIGKLYPEVQLPKISGGGNATVIAWLWARTVKSPNPAFADVDVPLIATFILSSKPGKQSYVRPVIEGKRFRFEVQNGTPPEGAENGTKAPGRGANFLCLMSGTPISGEYIKAEGKARRLGVRMMAIVAEGNRGRIYLSPTVDAEEAANAAKPSWRPSGDVPARLTGGTCVPYGLKQWGDLFTARQLVALATFADLVEEAREKVRADAIKQSMADDGIGFEAGGNGASAYADAVATYLAFLIDKVLVYSSSLCPWLNQPKNEIVGNTFGRQAFPMMWDFAEANVFAESSGNLRKQAEYLSKALIQMPARAHGSAHQLDASTQELSEGKVVSTDPPYYDNIAYADLSDFFYVWLRKSLRSVYPNLFATIAVPKAEELVASSYRHGSRGEAEQFFLSGMTNVMHRLAEQAHAAFPITIYYAFKQSDTTDAGTGNTGWETFLEAVIRAGLQVTGTWPLKTERPTALKVSVNALASSIVLVCRRRLTDAPSISRRDFLRELKDELAAAVEVMIGGAEGISPVAPVDLAQAVIGPGMGIFSKYSSVLEADGSPMTVHTALTLINRMLTEGGDDFDADTQFSLGWFDQQGWSAGEFGQADVLARAKGTSVEGLKDAGVLEAGGGRVRLVRPVEYPKDWNPEQGSPVWEALHQMVRALKSDGESAAGALLARMPQSAEPIRSLAYRLYTLCERKRWADDARGYNELITSWQGIEAASHEAGHVGLQTNMDI